MTVIEVVIHDPLYKWALTPGRAQQRQPEDVEGPGSGQAFLGLGPSGTAPLNQPGLGGHTEDVNGASIGGGAVTAESELGNAGEREDGWGMGGGGGAGRKNCKGEVIFAVVRFCDGSRS